ncbi:MAG TPA: BamA/TamA family outer membrane protein [Gemmatimonadales bacterium]|nr:BamA/TamA family outer membrane protein [Gemmatimonadales bacterium]
MRPWLVIAVAVLGVRDLAAQAQAPERTVTSVRFRGNHAIDILTLEAAIATSASSWTYRVPLLKHLGLGQRRLFDELEFRRDVVRLQILYRLHGFFEARVDTSVTRTARTADVVFRIDEGPPVLVDSIVVRGVDSVMDTHRLSGRLPLAEGKPFDRAEFDASADTVALALENRGYPFAAVFRNYTVDRAARTASVEYQAVPGRRARVGDIVIGGNQAVGARIIQRSLAVRDGDWFSQDALYDSQRSLYQTDLFRYVSVGIAADSVVAGADSLVRVQVQVNEGPRSRLRAGVGYGTIDCVRAQATLSTGNFLGNGLRLDLAGKVSKLGVGSPTDWGLSNSICSALSGDPFSERINYLASATFTQPAVFGRRSTLTQTDFAERRSEYKAFERNGIGSSVAASFGLGRASLLTVSYRLTYGSTTADTAVYCVYFDRCEQQAIDVLKERHRQAALSVSLERNTANSPIEPSGGSVLSLELSHASPLVGSEQLISYNKAVAEGSWYWQLERGWVVALRARGGVIRPGVAFVADTSIRFVPPEERFYAGGPASVRGFGRNEMGPLVYVADTVLVDSVTGASVPVNLRISPVGSYAIGLANFELRMPSPVWPSRLRLAAFVDAGELWDQTSAGLIPSGLKVTPGVGLRVGTPLGPVRLDVAYNDYPRQRGPLYEVIRTSSGAPQELRLVEPDYPGPPRGTAFFQRLQFQFSVGEAY